MYKQAFVIWKNKRVEYIENLDRRSRISKYNDNIALIVNVKRNSIREYEELNNEGYYYHLNDWYVNIRNFDVEYVAIHYVKNIDIIRYCDLQIDEIDRIKVVQVSYFNNNMNHLGTIRKLMSEEEFLDLLFSKIDTYHLERNKKIKSDPNRYKSGWGYKAGR